ncbi:MAG: hydroxysqualene dehydroxylase HpnE [Thalassobaculales bacterium]
MRPPAVKTSGKLHVVGGGLAGIAAALEGRRRGWRVTLYEATASLGGRCRSWLDDRLGLVIDNGSHLLLSANRASRAHVRAIGGAPLRPLPWRLPVADLAGGRRRHLPGLEAAGWLAAALAGRMPEATPLFALFCTSLLNTPPQEACPELLRRTLLAILSGPRGWVAPEGLAASLVPALAFTGQARLTAIGTEAGRARRLIFGDRAVDLGAADGVVLALPPAPVGALLGIAVPEHHSPIVNAHFRVDGAAGLPAVLGLLGGTAEWLFARGPLVSVTVSAADRLVGLPADELAAMLWADAARALGLGGRPPAWRIVKERRATLRQTPATLALRPGPRTALANLSLAGDWTATGLPCTIEGAILSGRRAVEVL